MNESLITALLMVGFILLIIKVIADISKIKKATILQVKLSKYIFLQSGGKLPTKEAKDIDSL